ncbi:MAG: heme biosynthesis HemY N-terminal domain-containing protein [Pseudomonadota bacterium]
MLRLIGFLIVTAALMSGATWIFVNDPGEPVRITWFGGAQLAPSLPYAVLMLIGVIVVVIVLYEILRLLLGYPARWFRKRQVNRTIQGLQTATKGLIAAASGDATEARELRRDSERMLGERHPANLLLAAQAAEMQDDHEVAQLKYRQMLRSRETKLLGLRGLLSDAIAGGDHEQALTLARQAHAEKPYTEWVNQTFFDLLTKREQWSEAFRRVDDLKLNRLIDGEQAQRLRAILKMMMAKTLEQDGKEREATRAALDATSRYRGFAPAAIYASAMAAKSDNARQARVVLEESWARQPHPSLAQAFAALVPNEAADARLARFDRLVHRNAAHHVTLRTMIELALAAGKADRAIRYAQQVPGSSPTAGTVQAAIEAYRATDAGSPRIGELETLAAQVPADEAWVCQSTGQVVDQWDVFGPDGQFDSLRWQSPPRVATLVASPVDPEHRGPTVDLAAQPA